MTLASGLRVVPVMKITTMTVPFLLVLAACASQPASTSPFHAPAMEEPVPPAESGGQTDETALSDVAPVQASPDSPLSMDVRHITVLLGARDVDNNGLENLDIDEQGLLGVEFDAYDRESGAGFEAGISISHADDDFAGQDVDATFTELYGGFRETFPLDSPEIHPYVGIGATLLHGEVDAGPADDSDTTLGAYIRAGINFSLSNDLRLGVDLRHVFAEFDMFGNDDFDADFDQFALTAAFPF